MTYFWKLFQKIFNDLKKIFKKTALTSDYFPTPVRYLNREGIRINPFQQKVRKFRRSDED